MKKGLLFFLLFAGIAASSCAQDNIFNFPIDSTTGKISFQGVVTVEGLKKDELFNKIKLWVITTYNSPKDIVNAEDKNIGVLKLKPLIKKNKTSDGLTYTDILYYDFDIYIKDGKYKYILSNIRYSLIMPDSPKDDRSPIEKPFFISKTDTEQMKYYDYRKKWSEEIKNDFNDLISSLHTFLIKNNKTDF
jgi:hypothetical protein